MEFRPCIDIHNGKVKQIVGGSLRDAQEEAKENFVSSREASFYAEFYKKYGIRGGHVIMLNAADSKFYEATRQQALSCLRAYPGGLQIGGGIHADNAADYLRAGASHVIVTSYVFRDGCIHYENLDKLLQAVGREHIVLDLSCRKKEDGYYIVTDRWQKFTDVRLEEQTMERLASCCDEFLVHAVDVEGKSSGIEEEVVALLGNWGKAGITYAGGVHSYEDLQKIRQVGQDKVNVTIGSALDLFGGNMKWEEVLEFFGIS